MMESKQKKETTPLILSRRPKKPILNPKDSLNNKLQVEQKLFSNLFPITLQQNQITGDITCFQYTFESEPVVAEDNKLLREDLLSYCKCAIQDLKSLPGKIFGSGNTFFLFRQPHSNENQESEMECFELPRNKIKGTFYSINVKVRKYFSVTVEEAVGQGQNHPKKGNQIIMVLHVIFKNNLKTLGFSEKGKSRLLSFKDSSTQLDKGSLEIHEGFQISLHPIRSKIYLKIDCSSAINRSETAFQYIYDNAIKLIDQIASLFIVGKSVITKYNNKQYVISYVNQSKNPHSTFHYQKTNQEITYVQYYKDRYQIDIQHQQQWLLEAQIKQYNPITNTSEPTTIFLIPELCTMTGLTKKQQSNSTLMREVEKSTNLNPKERYQKIYNLAQTLGKSSIISSGIKINFADNSITSYLLNPPTLTFGDGKQLTPLKASFKLKSPSPSEPQLLDDWLLIYQQSDSNTAHRLCDSMQKSGSQMQLQVSDPQFITIPNNSESQYWVESLDKELAQRKQLPKCIVSLSPTDDSLIYQALKTQICFQKGIPHQHVISSSLSKKISIIGSKILMQIAAKLGKKLWVTEIPQQLRNKHVMQIGIETSTKKTFIQQEMKQVVGVTASTSTDFTAYYSDTFLIGNRETIYPTHLSKIICKALQKYEHIHRQLPDYIIVYRQGIGEGSVESLIEKEVNQIIECFKTIRADYSPQLLFYQVNKQNGLRFFQKNQLKSNNNSSPKEVIKNPPVGSLIPIENPLNFALIAQNCSKGVAKPVFYTCLYNSTNLKEETIQRFTYYQCFNYYNWNGSVKVPAVMMYSSKLAKLLSDCIEGKISDRLQNTLFFL